jgi:Recombination endonuclease VII
MSGSRWTTFPRNRRTRDGRHAYCKPCHNARCRETRERLYGGSRHYHLKRRYGIGASDFDELVGAQDGRCAVCGRTDPDHVDHDHATGAVRGVLCFNCNGGLGQFGDDIERLYAAISYLERAVDSSADECIRTRALALRGA